MPLFIGGVLRDRGEAERVVHAMLDAGVASSEISLAVREKAEEDVSHRSEMDESENPFAELSVHSGWERLGWQGGARPAYRDRVPPDIEMAILAAGPLSIAIGGAQIGASAGGVIGSMANFGFTLDHARLWYDRLVEGAAWVMIRTGSADADRVRSVFRRFDAELPAESLRHW